MPPTKSVTKKNPSLIQGFINEAGQRLPQYKKQIDAVGPFVIKATDAIDAAYPYIVAFWKKLVQLWELAQPYHPEQYGPLFLGFAMCFFGGSYAMLIAAIEAVRMTVWTRLSTNFKVLYQTTFSLQEISDKELLTRKVYLFARTVDPNQVYESTGHIWSAFMAVIATLRISFAQAITLGTSLGELAENHLSKTTGPMIQKALPQDLQKWAAPTNTFLYRFIGVSVAWLLSRVIVGFHAAMRGANMFTANAVILARERGFLDEKFDAKGPKASAFTLLLAFLGFYWQLSNGFSMPFPFNL
ncbi:transmembrane protein, putative, partial [Bodo saltans]